jgi:hypothetical protein
VHGLVLRARLQVSTQEEVVEIVDAAVATGRCVIDDKNVVVVDVSNPETWYVMSSHLMLRQRCSRRHRSHRTPLRWCAVLCHNRQSLEKRISIDSAGLYALLFAICPASDSRVQFKVCVCWGRQRSVALLLTRPLMKAACNSVDDHWQLLPPSLSIRSLTMVACTAVDAR